MCYFHKVQIFMNAALNLALALFQDPELMQSTFRKDLQVFCSLCHATSYYS